MAPRTKRETARTGARRAFIRRMVGRCRSSAGSCQATEARFPATPVGRFAVWVAPKRAVPASSILRSAVCRVRRARTATARGRSTARTRTTVRLQVAPAASAQSGARLFRQRSIPPATSTTRARGSIPIASRRTRGRAIVWGRGVRDLHGQRAVPRRQADLRAVQEHLVQPRLLHVVASRWASRRLEQASP
jgi:hypothetical protein